MVRLLLLCSFFKARAAGDKRRGLTHLQRGGGSGQLGGMRPAVRAVGRTATHGAPGHVAATGATSPGGRQDTPHDTDHTAPPSFRSQEGTGFGSLQYLNANQYLIDNPLTVNAVGPAHPSELDWQGSRIGATPYWSTPTSSHTGMAEAFAKRCSPRRGSPHATRRPRPHLRPLPPPTPTPLPQAPRPHHSLAPQNPTPLTSPPQQLPAPTSCVLNDPRRVAPSQLASARPEPSGAAAAAALAAALAADGRVRVRHLPVWRLHGLPRLRVLRLL